MVSIFLHPSVDQNSADKQKAEYELRKLASQIYRATSRPQDPTAQAQSPFTPAPIFWMENNTVPSNPMAVNMGTFEPSNAHLGFPKQSNELPFGDTIDPRPGGPLTLPPGSTNQDFDMYPGKHPYPLPTAQEILERYYGNREQSSHTLNAPCAPPSSLPVMLQNTEGPAQRPVSNGSNVRKDHANARKRHKEQLVGAHEPVKAASKKRSLENVTAEIQERKNNFSTETPSEPITICGEKHEETAGPSGAEPMYMSTFQVQISNSSTEMDDDGQHSDQEPDEEDSMDGMFIRCEWPRSDGQKCMKMLWVPRRSKGHTTRRYSSAIRHHLIACKYHSDVSWKTDLVECHFGSSCRRRPASRRVFSIDNIDSHVMNTALHRGKWMRFEKKEVVDSDGTEVTLFVKARSE
ncbi:hypothetical protein CVT24_012467 [Panaeolus cyanescens]|uniref:Uncharacterized protein n=1 Tax=Panaeolus cyanescens TaxID=181874 RepID=A0A409WUG7_9AGAR|nr:hypothetical protein CVT24_012467 [Panaeolus cyanescens]